MRSEQILSADILDILFENRNKSYGAYDLRKHYSKRLGRALALTFITAGVMMFLALKLKKEKNLAPFIPDIVVHHFKEMPVKELPPAAVSKPKPPSVPAPKAPTQLFVKNILITKAESQATPLAKNLDSVAISGSTIAGVATTSTQLSTTASGATGAQQTGEPVAIVDKLTPLYTAEVMPAFPGGMEALRRFLQRHLHNPIDMEEGDLVSVKIKFVVSFEGKLQSFEIIEDGGKLFNNEVIRVLKKMPEWIPGKTKGEAVSVYYTIPVKFTPAE